MVSKKVMSTVLASAVAFTIAGASTQAHADKHEKEKCYGVVKAGANDCGNAAKTHSCAGHAEVDGDGGEWLSLPKGVCERLVHGSLTPVMDHNGVHHKDEKILHKSADEHQGGDH
jgi:uncharacterized membrane protein